MLITTEYSGFWYSLFYQLAFVSILLVYLFVCGKKKQPLANSLLIIITGAAFALIGSKLGTYSWADWQYLWAHKSFPAADGKTTIGVFIFGTIGLVLAKRLLKHSFSILDPLAFAIPVALIFQRIGCLFGGCCFGQATALPWGLQYGNYNHACHFHYMEGYIDSPAAFSLPVHPVPIYFILAAIFTLLLIFRFEKRFKAQGSLFLFCVSTLFTFRFLIEFFREAVTNHNLGNHFLGLKMVQWGLLVLLITNVVLIFFNEKKDVNTEGQLQVPAPSFIRALVFALLPLTLLTLGKNWFTVVELTVLRAAILFVFTLLIWMAFKRFTLPRFRFASAGLMALAVLLMGQYPVEKKEEQDLKKRDDKNIGFISGPYFKKKKTQTLTFGYLGRNIDFVYNESESCFGFQDTHEVGPNFGSGGVDYNLMWYKPSNIGVGFGIGGHYSSFQTRVNGGPLMQERLGGITGYFQMEIKEVVGFKAGLNAGRFPVINGDNFDAPILPLLYLRFGPPDRFFLDAGLANDIPFGFMASFFQMGGGIGLRAFEIDNASRLRVGVTKIADNNAIYISSDIYLKQWIVTPTIRLSESTSPNFGLKIGVNLGKE